MTMALISRERLYRVLEDISMAIAQPMNLCIVVLVVMKFIERRNRKRIA